MCVLRWYSFTEEANWSVHFPLFGADVFMECVDCVDLTEEHSSIWHQFLQGTDFLVVFFFDQYCFNGMEIRPKLAQVQGDVGVCQVSLRFHIGRESNSG